MDEAARREAAARFRLAVDMAEFGLGMMLEKLRREHPDESEEQLNRRLQAKLDLRPMDAPGRVVPWPRR